MFILVRILFANFRHHLDTINGLLMCLLAMMFGQLSNCDSLRGPL